ncbi:MAG: NAD(P)/FAD-dependent oxidoreductase [Bacteroidales bacterium]|nr:NAD(P)/FAD-dependent oxidoreductase [Bacteroidales bacterium]
MHRRAVIIGSGLGGLESGVILARNGYDVTVLEKHPTSAGGCLQTFARRSFSFDTGLHFVGALGEGQSLRRIFDYFGLSDLPWKQMDKDCVDEIVIDGRSFPLASGYDNYLNRLAEFFPGERAALEKYVALLKDVGDNIFGAFTRDGAHPLFTQGAKAWLEENFKDPLLIRVISGAFMRTGLLTDETPLYLFAQINSSFVQSAWRLQGGGNQIKDRLVAQIEEAGGRVITGATVRGIESRDGKVQGVRAQTAGGRQKEEGGDSTEDTEDAVFFPADIVISNIHPAITAGLCGDGLRKVYKDRLSSLQNGPGVFTANIALKPGTIPYLNSNVFIHESGSEDALMIHFYPPEGSDASAAAPLAADRIDLIAPMAISLVEKWRGSAPGARGEGYESMKAAMLEKCIAVAERRIPGLRDAIDGVWTSTPLSWEHYTGTPGGSAFGIRKDWRDSLGTLISPRTHMEGLYLTGQNLNLHGILGVSMTALLSCRQIPGIEI